MSGQNWNLPVVGDTIVNYTAGFTGRDVSAITQMRTSLTVDTNMPTGAIRWNDTNFNWESWSGSAWAALATTYGISISGAAGAVPWTGVSGKPTTVAGYGITDITTTYAPLTGGGVSGTWSISITGSAASLGGIAASNYAQLNGAAFTGTVTYNGLEIGTEIIPQNPQNGNYTLALTDVAKHIYGKNTGSQTITIPTNAAIPIPVGGAITVVNNGTTSITFTTTGLTVYKAGVSAAWASGGTMLVRGVCTWLKVETDTWIVSGSGLS